MNPYGNEVPLIEMRGITKSFGAIQALRGADLKLYAGMRCSASSATMLRASRP